MAPRDFSEDGAVGAGGGGGGVGGITMNDPGPAPASSTPSSSASDSGMPSSPVGGSGAPVGIADSYHIPYSASANDQFGFASNGRYYRSADDAQNASAYSQASGLSFSQGGAIDEDMGDDSNGTPSQDAAIQRALQSVQQVMSFGYSKYGLSGGGDNEGAPQQTAMNTTGFRQSDNIEDRRDDTQPPTSGSNYRTNFDDVTDRIQDFRQGYNPMSQSLGINDVSGGSSSKPAAPADRSAIDTDEDAA